ncbi:hypothetical protein KXW98_002307 [Aspergillus fumigatus]|nr:hypothetical protein CNMCM8689_000721 [Aspergillus fumigatus]KAH1298596.1 hypothetical protein KXX30_006449 [Aspergillus fumigatus]KAH1333104.1 hypothetical protein KXX47_001546 [Aspergillus fumigatus]KAH1389054.1 hypothetical protein KXX10_001104 [Aspergillus fumigatus]KAH1389186.1 hypothetical protein KXX50_001174 [Aspergillus fumigatus]
MRLDQQPPQPSVSERRGQRLAPLQTNFSRPNAHGAVQSPNLSAVPDVASTLPAAPRLQRLRPTDYQYESDGERVPLQQTPVKRQTSKSGLRGLFAWEKPARKANIDTKLAEIDEAHTTVTQTVTVADTPLSPSVSATPKTAMSMSTLIASPPGGASRTKLASKSRGKLTDSRPVAGDHGWKPPPLFQAYPQAIKHDCLWAPALSADSILRIQATAKSHSSSNDVDPQGNQPPNEEASAERKKKEEREKKHMRTVSDTIGKTEWSQKIYVLVTSGYILQYSASGKHDRLPEKMLQVGPRSVAFASDAIPGKRYVLQISQSSEEDSTATVDTHRPLFSRLGFHRSYSRRWTRTFLLVFCNAEEMSSWLLAVRAQIEARGGKKYISENLYDEDLEHQLRPKPSIRQMVQRDPNCFSKIYLQPHESAGSDEKDQAPSDQSRRSSYISVQRRSIVYQSGAESRSNSMSTTQTDVTPPVNGFGRLYPSASPPSGPYTLPNGLTVPGTSEPGVPPSSTTASMTKRLSTYVAGSLSTEGHEPGSSPPTVPEPILRSTSPPAPNFSVPSFSKRFAAKTVQAKLVQDPRLDCDQSNGIRHQESDEQLDALSAFPSPPQSPARNMSKMSLNDIHEDPSTVRNASPRRQLRVSNSEDSLADLQQRNNDHRSLPNQRLPITYTMPSHSRPQSIAIDPLSKLPSEPQPTRPTTNHGNQPHLELQRDRMYPTDRSGRPPSMARRKSMPGLSVGPPAAPPPNCPLPKIPYPIDPHRPILLPSASLTSRSSQLPPSKSLRDRQRSFASINPPTSHIDLPTAPSIDTPVSSGL